MKRDDLNHPLVQGNKWHKLKYNLQQAAKLNRDTLLTFGGAFSNHIAATAAAAKASGFKSIGIIRGQELAHKPETWSHTLKLASANGMQFQFVDRQTYRQKQDQRFLTACENQFPSAYIIPEGGSNQYAVLGFDDLTSEINRQCPNWTHLFTATGTGGTLAGLVHCNENAVLENTQIERKILGVAVLKKANYLRTEIEDLINSVRQNHTDSKDKKVNKNSIKWQLLTQYHDGGYAKNSIEGTEFQEKFETEFEILLDPIYTSKMVYAFYQELKSGKIPKGSKIILLHTGGLQGRT
ncbi:1-aminocyclopropane-1-carboxylate deaminase [Thiomicrorhabdus immobilis]|uniref:1-aminocyclopropane-1-carboxylate deaminase n=2 Tax=Thiomicrorhabdus immobilis TaxID=2791037 RepID=A0ABN6CZ70_9GAMM|nr:1-aminocyclopropane-1-carboxylate deaminase [Thiomicrorhabdus immobilis]